MVSKQAWEWTFIKTLRNLKFCTLMGSFCPKHNILARKFQRNYVSWYWEMMQNLSENWLVAWKMTWEWTFIKTLRNLKFCTLMGSFCPKHNILARKFQRNYVSWYWEMMQNLSENWLVAWKMTRNLVNFHTSSWKSENLHLMGSFCLKHIKF